MSKKSKAESLVLEGASDQVSAELSPIPPIGASRYLAGGHFSSRVKALPPHLRPVRRCLHKKRFRHVRALKENIILREDLGILHSIISAPNWYVMIDGKVKKALNMFDGGRSRFRLRSDNRRVLRTVHGEVEVSTVFLGLDHGWELDSDGNWRDYRPVVFETMVFGGPRDLHRLQCKTRAAAVHGHKQVCKMVFGERL